LTSFSLEIEELLDALLLAHQNTLHPLVLNSIQLKTILGNIQRELPENQVLPINIDSNSSLEGFIKLTKVTTKFSINFHNKFSNMYYRDLYFISDMAHANRANKFTIYVYPTQ